MPLTTGEFSVLKVLVQHPRQPLSRDKLMELARGREYEVFDRSIDVQISRLRKIVEEDPSHPKHIQTVWGFGYVFVPEKLVTLFARSFLLIALLIVTAVLASFQIYRVYEREPRSRELAQQTVEHGQPDARGAGERGPVPAPRAADRAERDRGPARVPGHREREARAAARRAAARSASSSACATRSAPTRASPTRATARKASGSASSSTRTSSG